MIACYTSCGVYDERGKQAFMWSGANLYDLWYIQVYQMDAMAKVAPLSRVQRDTAFTWGAFHTEPQRQTFTMQVTAYDAFRAFVRTPVAVASYLQFDVSLLPPIVLLPVESGAGPYWSGSRWQGDRGGGCRVCHARGCSRSDVQGQGQYAWVCRNDGGYPRGIPGLWQPLHDSRLNLSWK